MCKKWVSCVQLVCVLFCTFLTLYLNTLSVNASYVSFSYQSTSTFTYNAITENSYVTGSNGYITSSTSSFGTTVYHVKVPFIVNKKASEMGFDYGNGDTYITLWGQVSNMSVTLNAQGVASVSNIYLTNEQGDILRTGQNSGNTYLPYLTDRTANLFYADYSQGTRLGYFVEFDLTVSRFSTHLTGSEPYTWTITTNFSGLLNGRQAVASEIESAKTPVNDSGANDKLNTQIQQEQTAQTTRTGILNSLTSFFGSFFSNLIGVFVPEDGFFTTWFNNLNTLLEAKLGILYYPFAKIIYFLNNLTTAFGGSSSATITFPALEFTNQATGETYTFLSAQTVNLNDYNLPLSSSANSSLVGTNGYSSLIDIVRTFNGFVIVMLLLALLRQKLNLILRGDDNDS